MDSYYFLLLIKVGFFFNFLFLIIKDKILKMSSIPVQYLNVSKIIKTMTAIYFFFVGLNWLFSLLWGSHYLDVALSFIFLICHLWQAEHLSLIWRIQKFSLQRIFPDLHSITLAQSICVEQ